MAGLNDWPDEELCRVTSPQDPEYNCVAWALGLTDRNLWPTEPEFLTSAGNEWPDGLPAELTVEAFTALFETEDYMPCENGEVEDGNEKLALFGLPNGEPTHVARQDPNGFWLSKLGQMTDVEHARAEDCECVQYGTLMQFYRRPVRGRNPRGPWA